MSYNIKQLTNFDVSENTTISKNIFIGDHAENHDYYIIPYNQLLGLDTNQSINNAILIDISKFGYCVNDNEGMNYPIFIKFDTETSAEVCFYLGKSGIFEFQPEQWRDVNGDNTERTAFVSVKQVLVPVGVPFVLDYCYLV